MNKIKEFRIKHGLTQKEAAVILNRCPQQISKLERGIHKITSDVLFRIRKYNELSIYYHNVKKLTSKQTNNSAESESTG